MDETYRMLGREHEADLEREAAKWRLADQARERRQREGSSLLQRLTLGQRVGAARNFFVRGLRNIAVRLGVPSGVCFTLLTLALANVAGARGVVGAHSPAGVDRAAPATYLDAIGDAGDAPDIARVTITPEGNGFLVDVKLAKPTELGRYGWILFGVDTDRNPFTGGGRGDELVVFTNGEATTLERWIGGQFTPNFVYHDLEAAFSGTDLTFVLTRSDLRTRSFNFAVASLRQQADLAPGGGVAKYPRKHSAN